MLSLLRIPAIFQEYWRKAGLSYDTFSPKFKELASGWKGTRLRVPVFTMGEIN
jgi:hypothetical protein